MRIWSWHALIRHADLVDVLYSVPLSTSRHVTDGLAHANYKAFASSERPPLRPAILNSVEYAGQLVRASFWGSQDPLCLFIQATERDTATAYAPRYPPWCIRCSHKVYHASQNLRPFSQVPLLVPKGRNIDPHGRKIPNAQVPENVVLVSMDPLAADMMRSVQML